MLQVPQTKSSNATNVCLHPGLADLFEALGVICATAHAIKVLRNKRMIGLRQREPIDRLVAIVTRVRAYSQPNLGRDGCIQIVLRPRYLQQ